MKKKPVKARQTASTAKAKSTTKKVTTAVKLPKVKAIPAKQTAQEILTTIAHACDLKKNDVKNVLAVLAGQLQGHLMKGGSGKFTIPGLNISASRVNKPATKKRMGRNPATGEAIVIAAKPARSVIKVKALKALKTLVK